VNCLLPIAPESLLVDSHILVEFSTFYWLYSYIVPHIHQDQHFTCLNYDNFHQDQHFTCLNYVVGAVSMHHSHHSPIGPLPMPGPFRKKRPVVNSRDPRLARFPRWTRSENVGKNTIEMEIRWSSINHLYTIYKSSINDNISWTLTYSDWDIE